MEPLLFYGQFVLLAILMISKNYPCYFMESPPRQGWTDYVFIRIVVSSTLGWSLYVTAALSDWMTVATLWFAGISTLAGLVLAVGMSEKSSRPTRMKTTITGALLTTLALLVVFLLVRHPIT